MNLNQAKQILKEKGIDLKTIDFESFPDDIPIEEWLFNEYAIELNGFNSMVEQSKAEHEESEHENNNSLNSFVIKL